MAFVRIRCAAALSGVLALASCGNTPESSRISVSVVGTPPQLLDPNLTAPSGANAELLRATRQGLVAIDGTGQVEPALAESWTFTKDGLSVIFRLRRLKWPGGGEVTAGDAAASLNAALAPNSANRLKPLLSAIESVVAMTDRVVEIRLRVPRPNLLELLAQPELGITRRGIGTGPWDGKRSGTSVTLTLRPVDEALEDLGEAESDIGRITLRGERAALAIVRFRESRGGLVIGGTLADWPLLRIAQFRTSLVRLDPAQGLFGLAATTARPFIRDDDIRNALAKVIDRNQLVASFEVPGWQPIDHLLPGQLDSASPPAVPGWTAESLADRQGAARKRIAAWKAARGPLAPLKIALPAGSGMGILFARLLADWRQIGVDAVRVPWNDRDADLRLIDEVAPVRSANWYLTRTSCDLGLPCSTLTDFALKNSRSAPDLAHRAVEIAKADAESARWMAFIPLASPVRWSLVDPALTGFKENSFAAHPLAELNRRNN